MTTILWLLLFAIAVAVGWLIRHNFRKWEARRLAEEERFANFMAGTAGISVPKTAEPSAAPMPAPSLSTTAAKASGNALEQQKLLFDAAHKAAEAGEPALAIQLYARLLARYPASTLATPVRAAVDALKKKRRKEQ